MQAPGQVQRGSGEGSKCSGEGLQGFGAEPGQVQQGSGEDSGEGSGEGGGFGAEPDQGSTGFRRRFRRSFREALVQSQDKFNRVQKVPEKVLEKVPEKVPEKIGGFGGEGSGEGLGGFGAAPGQVQQGSGEGSGESSEALVQKPKSGSTGFWRRFRRRFQEALVQSQVRFNGLTHELKCFQRLTSQHGSEKIVKNKTLRLLGIPPKLILCDALIFQNPIELSFRSRDFQSGRYPWRLCVILRAVDTQVIKQTQKIPEISEQLSPVTVSRVLMILSISGFRNSKTMETFEPEKCRSA